MVKKIHTGIKKDQSFDFNLERARDLVKRYGFELAEEKLESMRLYSWIGHDPSFEYCGCLACDLLHQIIYDKTVKSYPELEQDDPEIVEIIISEFDATKDGFGVVERVIKVARVKPSEPYRSWLY